MSFAPVLGDFVLHQHAASVVDQNIQAALLTQHLLGESTNGREATQVERADHHSVSSAASGLANARGGRLALDHVAASDDDARASSDELQRGFESEIASCNRKCSKELL